MFGQGLLKGLKVTLRHFLESYIYGAPRGAVVARKAPTERGIFTVQYPDQRMRMFPHFRGSLMQKRNSETGESLCVGCGACARICPHGCITLETHRDSETRRQVVDRFVVDLASCMVCGLCVEACNFDALHMSHVYEIAVTSREDLLFDMEKLLANYDRHLAILNEIGAEPTGEGEERE